MNNIVDEVLYRRLFFGEIISRVFLIQYNQSIGTCFAIDIDNQQYFITAKHVIKNIKDKENIKIFRNSRWEEEEIHLIGHHPKVDISVFSLNFRPNNITKKIECDTDFAYGQDIYFLGFPLGLKQEESATLVNTSYPLPFIKKGILSAILQEAGEPLIILDGINNPGFSGGPFIFYNFKKSSYCIAGVISGYLIEPHNIVDIKRNNIIEALSQGNSGLIRSYTINYALKLIESNPTGYKFM